MVSSGTLGMLKLRRPAPSAEGIKCQERTTRFCYVRSYLRYDQEDFLDMNQVTRRGTNWHNLVVNDSQNQWYGGTG